MAEEDLPAVGTWLHLPHVARWWAPDTTAEEEVAKYRRRISQSRRSATVMLTVMQGSDAIGWCQWYRWADYPAEAEAMGAREGEAGIDYAIGDLAWIGCGAGIELIAALVAEVRRHHSRAGVLVGPDASNAPSRCVLEKNGFELVAIRPVATEPSDAPIAIYRLPAAPSATGIRRTGRR
jgi:aminoglycoside 6'-N-acetyltransferase